MHIYIYVVCTFVYNYIYVHYIYVNVIYTKIEFALIWNRKFISIKKRTK